MAKQIINMTDIGDMLYSLMYLKESEEGEYIDGVSKNVFMDVLPSTTDYSKEDMVVIDLRSKFSDNNAYGSGQIVFYLYADVRNLQDLEYRFESTIDEYNASEKASKIELNRVYSAKDYDTQRKMSFYVKSIRLKIK